MTGKNSIIRNLPHPEIHVEDDHAYVAISDCIADTLAHGVHIDSIQDHPDVIKVTSSAESQAAQDVYRNAVTNGLPDDGLVIYWKEWFDDMDPNHNKDDRGSVWVKTITFGKSFGNRNDPDCTYVVALGPKKANHNVVEAFHAEDMLEMKQNLHYCYSKRHNREVAVHAELPVSMADQPARRDAAVLSHGNGTHGARWGHSGNLDALSDIVPACAQCFTSVLDGTDPLHCTECANWESTIPGDPRLDYEPPGDCPESELPPSGSLSPFRITFETMINAVTTAHNGVISGEMSRGEAEVSAHVSLYMPMLLVAFPSFCLTSIYVSSRCPLWRP